MVRHLLYVSLALACGCELLVDDGARALAVPDEASDALEAAVARDAPSQADSGRQAQDATGAQDGQIADAPRAPLPPDAGCGQDCAGASKSCVEACVQGEAACESGCNGSRGCMNKCTMSEQACVQTCGMQCMMCFGRESCPPQGGVWSCVMP